MQVAMNWMLGGFLVMLLGVGIFCGSLGSVLEHVKARIYPNGDQELATTCYVDERTKKITHMYDGYIYDGSKKTPCKIIDESETEVKVDIRQHRPHTVYAGDWATWIPKKDFHPYIIDGKSKEEIRKLLR